MLYRGPPCVAEVSGDRKGITLRTPTAPHSARSLPAPPEAALPLRVDLPFGGSRLSLELPPPITRERLDAALIYLLEVARSYPLNPI